MSHYQSLLDAAVALVNAERGFIVLYDPATGIPIQIVAAHNFSSALVFQPVESVSKDYQVIQKALPLMAREKQPLLTHNHEERYFSLGSDRFLGSRPDRALRSLIVAPLHSTGLLWCDVKLKNGLFQPYDLQAVIALVQRSGL